MILLKKHYYFNLIIIFSELILVILTATDYTSPENEITNILGTNPPSGITTADLSKKGGKNQIFDDVGYQMSFIGNQDMVDSQGVIKLPQIRITDECKKAILEKNSGSTDIVVATMFRERKFDDIPNNKNAGITGIIDVVYYQFFPYKNNAIQKVQVDISSICKEKIYIFSPLYINEELKKKALDVAGQNPKTEFKYLRNYDIFDPSSKIYKDICYPVTLSKTSENIFSNYDISLEQRKKYYFPGKVQLCPSNDDEKCEYIGLDIETVSVICECPYKKYEYNHLDEKTEHDNYIGFTFDEKKFNNTKKDNYFTMEAFKCVTLPFSSTGFKKNYGSYIMIALICIIALSYIILAVSGKYHLLSVLELLYNSNIKSMNYIKGNNLGSSQNNNFLNPNQNPYDTRSNNLLLSSQRGITTNGLLMAGTSNFNGANSNQIRVGKKKNTNKSNKSIQIVNKNALNKNNNKKEKEDLVKVDEVKEHDLESENNSIDKDKTEIKSVNKENSKINDNNVNNKREPTKEEVKKSDAEEEEEQDVMSSKRNEQSIIIKKDNDNKNTKDNKENKDNQSKDDEDEEEEEDDEEEDNDNKANPPKKKNSSSKKENGANIEEKEKEKKEKKKKTPIEIALNVKELRDMMFSNMPQAQPQPQAQKKDKDDDNNDNDNDYNNKKNGSTVQNMPQNNGFPFNPFMNPMSFFPPNFPFNNNNGNNNNNTNNEEKIRREYEERARQRELEFQKELAQIREKERQREMDDLRERERQRQRDLDYERERRQRDDLYRSLERGYDKERNGNNDKYDKEKMEQLEKEKEEIKKMKKKLEKQLDDAKNKSKEKDLELQKELTKVKEEQKEKESQFEKQLLKQKDELREQFEKEKKEIIEKKDKEIQNLREEKDREIQRLKEDKAREIKYMKEDMDREKKSQNEKLKRKEKELKKEKQKLKETQKMTANNSFNMGGGGFNPNATLQQQLMDLNNSLKYTEKIETPQIVVPIDSIFTDQELNAMDFKNSCQFDKRTLCQVYRSYINRKQPLFFLFNYNSSSSGSVSTFQINYTSVKFMIFCIEIMIYMFFYCTFFGSKSITDILNGQFTFKKKFIFAIIISPVCMIVKSIIHHFIYDSMNVKIAEIKMRCYTNFIVGKKPEEMKVNEFKDFWESDQDQDQQKEIKEDKKEEMADIQEIEDDNLPEEEKARRKQKYEKMKLKTLIKDLINLFKRKIIISIIVMIPSLFIEWYYVSAFCAVYKNSQLTFFLNILISYGIANIIPFIYCMIPTIFRTDAIREESKLVFFISQIFQII